MAETNQYNRAGGYTLSKIDLENFNGTESVDIRSMVDSLVIDESIFSPSVTGYVDITDTMGMHYEFPIFGQEKITINFGTADDVPFNRQDRSFRVYKLSDKKQDNPGSTSYRLWFASEEYLKNETLKISKAYVGKPNSVIARDLMSFIGTTKPFLIDSTIYNQKIVVPFLNPFTAIYWLTSFSQHSQTDSSVYFFFEDYEGFKFRSLKQMMFQTPVDDYTRVFKNLNVVDQQQLQKVYTGIESMYGTQYFDSLGGLSKGLLGSNLKTLDLVTRTYTTSRYDYAAKFNEQKHLEEGTFSTAGLYTFNSGLINPDACRKFIISPTEQEKSTYVKSKKQDTQVFSMRRENLLQNTLSQMLQLDQIQFQVTVPGDSRLRAGSVVNLEIPSYVVAKNGKSGEDDYYSGKFLVLNLSHRMMGQKYVTVMTVAKDSVRTPRRNQSV